MKDAAKLLLYLAATILLGAAAAPPLYWLSQWLAAQGVVPFLGNIDFERFFHRSLLIVAVLFLWPLLRFLRVRSLRHLELYPDQRRFRHYGIGFLLAAIPLLFCGWAIVGADIFAWRTNPQWHRLPAVVGSALAVPVIEELFFRGLLLGLLLRAFSPVTAGCVTAGIYSIVHFLKAPEGTSETVTWTSGFVSIAHAFHQFREPMLLLAGFTTLFLIGLILAHARMATKSLWLPTGLHAGWIFANGFFNRIARREELALPWLGKNLLVGLLPLCVAGTTWLLVWLYLRNAKRAD